MVLFLPVAPRICSQHSSQRDSRLDHAAPFLRTLHKCLISLGVRARYLQWPCKPAQSGLPSPLRRYLLPLSPLLAPLQPHWLLCPLFFKPYSHAPAVILSHWLFSLPGYPPVILVDDSLTPSFSQITLSQWSCLTTIFIITTPSSPAIHPVPQNPLTLL